jgi:7-keto-8-aminopelargonate synthetase-like enzyme
VNEARGDRIRHSLAKKTRAILQNVHELGLKTPNVTGFPIIEIPLAHASDLPAVGDFLFDHGIYVTLAAYPLVPRDQVGFRIQVTAANEDDEIEELNQALKGVAGRFELQLES